MTRDILLIEPNYKNKYPPMGLMKLATYYKGRGDRVIFFKGKLTDLALDITLQKLLKQLQACDKKTTWELYLPQIRDYIHRGSQSSLNQIPATLRGPLVVELLKYYRRFYLRKEYFNPEFRPFDRVCVTTLFTFHWDITIETINFVKNLCKTPDGVMVGGVMASILAERIKDATGIAPFVGTLCRPRLLDPDGDEIVDTLPLDYSILEEIDYRYPAEDAYFAYMTRGCVNRCSFCVVPKIEPQYIDYLPVAQQVRVTSQRYGAKRDLLLLDNNVLASPKFNEIIDEIKAAGFSLEDKYVAPNLFELAVTNLREGVNDRAYTRMCVRLFRELIKKRTQRNEPTAPLELLLDSNGLLNELSATKSKILDNYHYLKPYFNNYFNTRPQQRHVDFNQGLDSRQLDDAKMSKLAEIPIAPIRIAFDHWSLRATYSKAVRTAARHGGKNLSNYLLYNFKDRPLELYWRLKLNIDLCEELNISIYSFPMKYLPIEDPLYFSNRDYIGPHWNRKFIRTIQAILNATKGKVGRGRAFFEKAFGANDEEFTELLYMPETMIIYRLQYEQRGITEQWREIFRSLTPAESALAYPLIETNSPTLEMLNETIAQNSDLSANISKGSIRKLRKLIEFYQITRQDAQK